MDQGEEDITVQLIEPSQYVALKRRWYIVILFGLMGMLQALVWDGWSTISTAALYAYPDWDDSTIALLGNWGEICYLVGVVPLSWLIQSKGVRVSAILCGIMIAMGTGIRCLQVFYIKHKHSGTIFKVLSNVGSILNGGAGVVSCVCPSVISALWFPPGQRTTATGLSWVMLELGNAVGFLMGPLLVPDPPPQPWPNITATNSLIEYHGNRLQMREDIMILMYTHFGAAMVLLILIVGYFPARPPVAPSASSEIERDEFREGLTKLLKNKSVILLVLAYSLSQGIQEAILPVLNLDLGPIGITEDTVGWIGFWAAIASCGAALVSAHLADRLIGHFKKALLVLLVAATLSFTWLLLICLKVIPFSLPQMYASVLLGFASNYACTPLFFELASELAYPVGEGVVAGLMTGAWCFVGIIFLSLFFIQNIGFIWMNWSLIGSTLVGIPLLIGIKEEYLRTEADEDESLLTDDVNVLNNES